MCLRVSGHGHVCREQGQAWQGLCESRCQVLAWTRRGAWGQPGLVGRRREVCTQSPATSPSPSCPIFGTPLKQAGLGLSRGPTRDTPTPSPPDHAPLGMLLLAPPSSPLPQRHSSAPLPSANEAMRPPHRAGGRIAPLSQELPPQPPPHLPYWSPNPAGQCEKEQFSI